MVEAGFEGAGEVVEDAPPLLSAGFYGGEQRLDELAASGSLRSERRLTAIESGGGGRPKLEALGWLRSPGTGCLQRVSWPMNPADQVARRRRLASCSR